MQDSRNNIMFRKPKAYSGRNNTTADSEYLHEQARIKALQTRREQISEHRRIVLYGSSEERTELKLQIEKDAQLQLYIKDQKFKEEKEKSVKENELMEEHRKALLEREGRIEEEKRERWRKTQEENRLMAIAKKSLGLEMKVKEDVKDRNDILENIQRYQPNVI